MTAARRDPRHDRGCCGATTPGACTCSATGAPAPRRQRERISERQRRPVRTRTRCEGSQCWISMNAGAMWASACPRTRPRPWRLRAAGHGASRSGGGGRDRRRRWIVGWDDLASPVAERRYDRVEIVPRCLRRSPRLGPLGPRVGVHRGGRDRLLPRPSDTTRPLVGRGLCISSRRAPGPGAPGMTSQGAWPCIVGTVVAIVISSASRAFLGAAAAVELRRRAGAPGAARAHRAARRRQAHLYEFTTCGCRAAAYDRCRGIRRRERASVRS